MVISTKKNIRRVCLAWGHRNDCGEIRGIGEYARRFGPFQFLLNSHGDIELETLAQRTDIAGIIVHRFQFDLSLDWSHIIWPKRVPIVSIEGHKSLISDWQVMPDDRAVGRLAAQELLERGFRRFAYCPPPKQIEGLVIDWSENRLAGFRQAIAENGIPEQVHVYDTPTGMVWGQLGQEWAGPLSRWLVDLPKPIGVLAGNDTRARHVLLAAGAAGVHVPEEAAVIGVDNSLMTDVEACGLSSVELDGFRAGYKAMEILHRRIEGEDVPPGIVRIAPRGLVTRRSSDVLAIEDREVAAAMHFIAQHATAGLNVSDVVESLAVSRRSLEYRFQAVLGRSILNQIRAVQIERAKILLSDPEIPIRRVARACGFRSAAALSEIFRRRTGSTPRAYRAAHAPAPA